MNIEYTMLMRGSKNYFEKSIDPLFDHYKPIFDDEGWKESSLKMESSEALYINKTVSASGTGFLANFVLGTVVFVAGWSTTKLLDHFFKDKLINKTEELAKHLRKLFKLSDNDKSIEIRHVVWFEDIDLAIVIRLLVDKDTDFKMTNKLMLQAHKNASDWYTSNGKSAPVHSYLIKGGQCNIEPKLYMSLHDMDSKEGLQEHKKRIKKFQASSEDVKDIHSKLKNS